MIARPLRSRSAARFLRVFGLVLLNTIFCSENRIYSQTLTEAWVQRHSFESSSIDDARNVVTDTDGNIVVSGYSTEGTTGLAVVTIKYSSAGVPLWTNRYNGPNRSSDPAPGLAVSRDGTVYVALSPDDNIGYDHGYATIAYSVAGVPLWTNRYLGPGNGGAWFGQIAVDDSGKVFVTGGSDGGQYVTIAISSTGTSLWTNRYNGHANAQYAQDQPAGIALDRNGNIYVTGFSTDASVATTYSYATVAYSGDGVPLWTNRFKATVDSVDQATAVAVDANGNVFVTGSSYWNYNYDYATVAYSSAGVPLWTNIYNGPAARDDEASSVAVDSNGHVFVTGFSGGGGNSSDFATIAYTGTGVPLWTNRYNGTGPYSMAKAITTDRNGNVSVTGRSYDDAGRSGWATVSYSGTGAPLWTNRYSGPYYSGGEGIAADGEGNILVTGGSGSDDYLTIKYSNVGIPLWTNRYDGRAPLNSQAEAVAVDRDGNVFVTGSSGVEGSSLDFLTIKYSASGLPIWTNRYNGPDNDFDGRTVMALDRDGNVFVTGSSMGAATAFDYATVKYSSSGVQLWARRFNGPYNWHDFAHALAVDGNGNVVVTGDSTANDLAYNSDYATVKYSGAGVPIWTNRFKGLTNGDDHASSVSIDISGNIFVTGYSSRAPAGYSRIYEYATIKYSSAGVPIWTNRYSSSASSHSYATAMALDNNGNVIVTGYSFSGIPGDSSDEYVTIKYSSAGVPLWTNRYTGPTNDFSLASALAVDSSGNVLVAGAANGVAGGLDYLTIKLSSAGVLLWANSYNGTGYSDNYAEAVAVDGEGNVFVTGYSANRASYPNDFDYATIKYSSAGISISTNRYKGPYNGDDQPNTKSSLALGPNGGVYVTGASQKGQAYEYATVKYAPRPSIVCGPAFVIECNSTSATPTVATAQISFFTTNTLDVVWNLNGTSVQTNSLRPASSNGSNTVTLVYDLPLGTSIVIASVTDANSAPVSCTNTATLVDSSPPLLTILGNNPFTNECHAPFVDPGAIALDLCAGDVRVSTNSDVDPNLPGIYSIVYFAADPSGNSVTNTRVVIVADTAPPETACSASLVVDATNALGNVVVYQPPTAYDLCAGTNLTLACLPPSGAIFLVGTNAVFCEALDYGGNVSRCSFTISVLGPHSILLNILEHLIALRSGVTDSNDISNLEQIIAGLTAALDPSLWLDETHLQRKTGQGEFTALQTEDLCELSQDPSDQLSGPVLEGLWVRLRNAERLLAATAIQEAIAVGGAAKRINQASAQLALGDEQTTADQCAACIAHYKNAWNIASHAILTESVHLDSHVHVEIFGDANRSYLIQTSTNLIHWVTVATAKSDSDGVVYYDAGPIEQSQARFFRTTDP